jgi:hypothetical protein
MKQNTNQQDRKKRATVKRKNSVLSIYFTQQQLFGRKCTNYDNKMWAYQE